MLATPVYHASDAGLPVVALLRYIEMENNIAYEPCPPEANCINPGEVLMKKATEAVKKHLDWMISVTDRQNNHFGYAKQVVKTGGKIKTSFFIPHDNETNYWWQGESARLGSLASAAVYASRMLSYTDSVKAFRYAADQLDWLLGKNPFDLSVMKGVGTKNPPAYQSYSSTTFAGGIANGITGKNSDGSGIVWDDYGAAGFSESWQTWRWEEQWLPHATWYLMALATRYDEHPVKIVIPTSSSSNQDDNSSSDSGDNESLPQISKATAMTVTLVGNSLQVNFANPAQRRLRLMDVQGLVVMNAVLPDAANTVQLTSLPKGIYLVQVQGFAPKKIVIR